MIDDTLEAKRARFAQSRLSNYAASLRLEGFPMTPEDAKLPYKTREELIEAILGRQAAEAFKQTDADRDNAPLSSKETP